MKSGTAQHPVNPGINYKNDADSSVLSVGDRSPGYSEGSENSPEERLYYECFKPFEDRIKKQVNEDRLFHDELGVAIMAMKLGLCMIEGSEKDAIALRDDTWLENGKERSLKQELLDSLGSEVGEHNLENLESLESGELLSFYRKLKGRKTE